MTNCLNSDIIHKISRAWPQVTGVAAVNPAFSEVIEERQLEAHIRTM